MEDTIDKTELERFLEFTDNFGERQAAAEALGVSVNYIFALRNGKRQITDEVRSAWKRAGGNPDMPESVKVWLENDHHDL